jgi:hypothetical protein
MSRTGLRAPVLALALVAALAPSRALAQDATSDSLAALRARLEALTDRLDGMTEQVQTLRSDTDKLRKFKFSGYVQARYEIGENSTDSVKVAGSPATLTAANGERFFIRRARLKLAYDASPWSEAVVYFDGGQDRTIRLLEAYVTLLDPWTPTHQHRLTVGQMNVPFGFEIERSSSARELPERSRAENVLFAGERDRGIKLVSQWTPQFETVVGLFNGPGVSSADFPSADPDRRKDAVARARFSQGVVDGAVSWYGGRAVTALTGPDVVTDKRRLGFDGQVDWELPRIGGGTLRAEVYAGHEVNPDSVKALTTSNTAGRLLKAGADPGRFATDMQGGYVMWVQNIGDGLQAVARYDWYDPNVDRDHDRFRRTGLGLNAFFGGNTRVTVAYDIPTTDVAVAGGGFDDPHDNLWTFQVQHRF